MKSAGIVTSRTCPHCGHHEIGLTTRDGIFHPLKPGTLVQVLEEGEVPLFPGDLPEHLQDYREGISTSPLQPTLTGGGESALERPPGEGGEAPSGQEVWVPEPLRGDRRLRLKYGVTVDEKSLIGDISPEAYKEAYLGKLRRLIEREIHVPWAVILDRFFTAPHLAEGDPKEIAKAMWEELDEIRGPVFSVTEWLVRQDEESLAKMIQPRSVEELGGPPATDDVLRREMEELSFEEFLEML
jgi:hypothetical protein